MVATGTIPRPGSSPLCRHFHGRALHLSQGRDVLIIYDDLTYHARAYRELSLLLRRPGPGGLPRRHLLHPFPPLERSTHLRKERAAPASLPIVETEAQDISGYIPTNLISITDGQLYLSPRLYQKVSSPPWTWGNHVSRVGGKAQLPAYRAVAGDVRISFSQFEELETFSRFGTRLDEATRKVLERGWRVREILKQPQYKPIHVAEQVAAILAVTSGMFDGVATHDVQPAEDSLREYVREQHGAFCARIAAGEKLGDTERDLLVQAAQATAGNFIKENDRADR